MKLKRSELRPEDHDDWRDDRRPPHQIDRGPRHGNNRNMYAKLKVAERRRQRAEEKRQPWGFE